MPLDLPVYDVCRQVFKGFVFQSGRHHFQVILCILYEGLSFQHGFPGRVAFTDGLDQALHPLVLGVAPSSKA